MKKYEAEMPDLETIERYWGSLEAYQEEQRRTAIVNLEAKAEDEIKTNWSWDFIGRRSRSQVRRFGRHGDSYKLFGHKN
ncbi:MAG TPA: hypothetical protein VH186_27625 [Chloroflexia bacterium]|nr:hypothetical protein [Chloroflexia bacterium]